MIDNKQADQNNVIKINDSKVELSCQGGTITILPSSASVTPPRTLAGNLFTYEGAKKEFFATCKIGNLSCFGKFELAGSGTITDPELLCGNGTIDGSEQCDGLNVSQCSE